MPALLSTWNALNGNAYHRDDNCVVVYRLHVSRWYFEETYTFVEITGAVAMWHLKQHIHPGIIKMWSHLRRYTMYFLQYRPGQHTPDQVRRAQGELLQYAQYCQDHLGGKLLTSLLHRACFHIPEQVLAGLPGAFCREDWGERCIRAMKQYVTGHATVRVAKAAAYSALSVMCLRHNANRWPGLEDPVHVAAGAVARRRVDTMDAAGVMLGAIEDAHGSGEDGNKVRQARLHPVGVWVGLHPTTCTPPATATHPHLLASRDNRASVLCSGADS